MEVPKSPFTLEGLKQSGISAFNTFRKNPIKTVMSPMVPKNPYMAAGLGLTGIYGLLPESTKKFLTEGLPGGDFDMDFARREAEKAKARQEAPEQKENKQPLLRSILDYFPAGDFDRDFALRESQKITDRIVDKSDVRVKKDDVETGPEKLENKTPDLKKKVPTQTENKQPKTNQNDAIVLVNDQKKSIKNAEKVFNALESEARKQGKMTKLSEAMDAAKQVMGERGYNKSGKLLLLQLASNLLTGKTMQSGIPGFLDVLGQAGQNVIPMAIALEREREKEELSLAKVLLESEAKKAKDTKIKAPSIKIRYKQPNGEISDPIPASLTEEGYYIGYENIGGQPEKIKIDPSSVIGQAPIADNVANKAKILNEYKAVKSGDLYTNLFIKVAAENPDLIGVQGGWKKLTLKFGELANIATGSKSYKETILKLKDREETNFQNFKAFGEVEDGVDKKLQSIFQKIETKAQDLDSASEEIQAQALLETLELLSTYALAQTLKDKDRLAVADIERAEKRLGGTVGYVPFYDQNPLEILTAYKTVNETFKNRLGGIRNQWKDVYYYNPMELDAIDKDFAQQMIDKNQENINKFIEGYTPENNQDQEAFSNIFNKDNLQGIIKE